MTRLGSGANRLGEPLIVISPCSLAPSISVPSAPAALSTYGRSTANCRRAATAAGDVSAVAKARKRSCSASRVESAIVFSGPSGFHTGYGARGRTQAPLTLLRYTARLSGVERSARITGPATVLPPVPSVQPQLCAVIARENGATSRSVAGPRSQITP